MFNELWVALILLTSTPDCMTDSCLDQERTITIHSDSEAECYEIIAFIAEHDDIGFANCIRFDLDAPQLWRDKPISLQVR